MACNPGMCPYRIDQGTVWFTAGHSIHWGTPPRAKRIFSETYSKRYTLRLTPNLIYNSLLTTKPPNTQICIQRRSLWKFIAISVTNNNYLRKLEDKVAQIKVAFDAHKHIYMETKYNWKVIGNRIFMSTRIWLHCDSVNLISLCVLSFINSIMRRIYNEKKKLVLLFVNL